jgi:ERCC4-related helicase
VWSADTEQRLTITSEELLPEPPERIKALRELLITSHIWNAFQEQTYIAPLLSHALALPHQFRTLRHSMERYPVRILLADEVGLGKTIEAGLVLKQLVWQNEAKRILILMPKSLMIQWVAEMDTRFGEKFEIVVPARWESIDWLTNNPWRQLDRVVVSFDSVKPKNVNDNTDKDTIRKRNRERFEALVAAGWDLVIIDECHRVAGLKDDVARYELAKSLAKTVPHILLLSATPHSGRSDAFQRLMRLLVPPEYTGPLTKNKVRPYLVRTEKRTATDETGRPLFAPRSTTLLNISFGHEDILQAELFQAVSEYVVSGYNRARRRGGNQLLLILIQRLMSSSTRSVRQFLEKRLRRLTDQRECVGQLTDIESDDVNMDEMEQMALLAPELNRQEADDVRRLLDLAIRTEASRPDVRASALYSYILDLAREENDAGVKFLVFTEFRATQEMLAEFLRARGYEVTILNGGMDLTERQAAQRSFAGSAQVLIATDAGGEGLNLQFAHIVFNYDLPWNPMRVEQRIGRVDRIGQAHPVRVFNLAIKNSVEARIYDVWMEKLATILREFGVDKTGDVLDSHEAGSRFEELARTALIHPDRFESQTERLLAEIRKQAREAMENQKIYEEAVETVDCPPQCPAGWLWNNADDVEQTSLSDLLLRRMRALRGDYAEGYPCPHWHIKKMGFFLKGWFSLWQVGIAGENWQRQKFFSVCVSDEGRSFPTAGRQIWDAFGSGTVIINELGDAVVSPPDVLRQIAENEAKSMFHAILVKERKNRERRIQETERYGQARLEGLHDNANDPWIKQRRIEIEYDIKSGRRLEELEPLPQFRCLAAIQVMVE